MKQDHLPDEDSTKQNDECNGSDISLTSEKEDDSVSPLPIPPLAQNLGSEGFLQPIDMNENSDVEIDMDLVENNNDLARTYSEKKKYAQNNFLC